MVFHSVENELKRGKNGNKENHLEAIAIEKEVMVAWSRMERREWI